MPGRVVMTRSTDGTTEPSEACTRRAMLRYLSAGALSLSAPALLGGPAARGAADEVARGTLRETRIRRAQACIVLWMTGGPPQHETWDPKPEAPAEIRGPFGTI